MVLCFGGAGEGCGGVCVLDGCCGGESRMTNGTVVCPVIDRSRWWGGVVVLVRAPDSIAVCVLSLKFWTSCGH